MGALQSCHCCYTHAKQIALAGNGDLRDLFKDRTETQTIATDRSTVHLNAKAVVNDSEDDGKEKKKTQTNEPLVSEKTRVSEKDVKSKGTQTQQEVRQLPGYKPYDDGDYEPFPNYVEPPVPEHREQVQLPLGPMQYLPTADYEPERIEVLQGLSTSPPEVQQLSFCLPSQMSPFANELF